MAIEYVHDGGDFAEIRINGKMVLELCSDLDDLGTARSVAENLAAGLNMPFTIFVEDDLGEK